MLWSYYCFHKVKTHILQISNTFTILFQFKRIKAQISLIFAYFFMSFSLTFSSTLRCCPCVYFSQRKIWKTGPLIYKFIWFLNDRIHLTKFCSLFWFLFLTATSARSSITVFLKERTLTLSSIISDRKRKDEIWQCFQIQKRSCCKMPIR